MKKKFVDFYIDVASRTSELSHARRLKVGAIVVKNDSILSYGYNGTPSSFDNNCEEVHFVQEMDIDGNIVTVNSNRLITKPEVIHAEVNAIGKAASEGYSCKDATMFLTHAPCIECAKVIWRSGINRVYYKDEYRSTSGIELLRKTGVEIIHHARDNLS